LVLQLVERVLAVCPIAIQLTERQDLAVERGHQRGVFPDLPIRPDLGKAEPRLSGVAVIDDRQRTFQLAPQQNDPPLPAQTFQPQTGLLALPALAGLRPVKLVWEIERRLAEDGARPVIFYPRGGTCRQPWVKGLTIMVNSIYNGWRNGCSSFMVNSLFNGWRMEDVSLDK
jgi:hypothetical protein